MSSELPGKDLLQSKSFWGIVVMVLGIVLGFYGYAFPDPEAAADQFVDLATLIVEAVGVALTLYGTVVRKTTIATIAGFPIPGRR